MLQYFFCKGTDTRTRGKNTTLRSTEEGDGGKLDGLLGHADVQGIEGIRAIGTMLQQVLFRLCQFLACLVLPEAVRAADHFGGLDGYE